MAFQECYWKEKEQELLEKFKNSKNDLVLTKQQSVCEHYVSPYMNAKEMFEKLNYLIDEGENHLNYWKRKGNETGSWASNVFGAGAEIQILFNKYHKTVEKVICDRGYGKLNSAELIFEPASFNIEELKAINQQCKELGWI